VQWIHQRQINGGPLERCCPKGDSHSLPGASTLDPPHVSFNHQTYTSLIYIFYSNTNINSIHSYLQVLMFNPSSGTHVLSCGTALANTRLCFGAGGMPPALVHIFHLMAQHSLMLSCLMVHTFNSSSGVHMSSMI